MNETPLYIVSCSGTPVKKEEGLVKYLELEYRDRINKNVNIELNNFTTKVYKIRDRYKDLLEIAGYVFAADRKALRGRSFHLEFHSWSRKFHFHFKVRDYDFWNQEEIKALLSEALCFMTGDEKYEFTFHKAEPDFPTDLFDNEKFELDPRKNLSIVLFSGGLDSLAGALEKIETTNNEICLVSHQSGQPGVQKTQNELFNDINLLYPGRCKHYKFYCGLSNTKSIDETQRTRAFLYNSTAFVLAKTYKQSEIDIYENGITTINFAKTQDLMNGRASRTTHPKTIRLLELLFTKIGEKPFKINHTYFYKTKTDVFDVIKKYNRQDLLKGSVTCSRTRNHPAKFTHCGTCSQCIDRIFAAYASKMESFDESKNYHFKFYKENINDKYTKKAIIDYLRQADEFSKTNEDYFFVQKGPELIDLIPYIEAESDSEGVRKVFGLCQRHSKQIEFSIHRLRGKYDKPFSAFNPKSFFSLIVGLRAYQGEDGVETSEEEKGREGEEETAYAKTAAVKRQDENGNEEAPGNKLKQFKKGELQELLHKYVEELKLEMGVSVESKKVQLITRKIIAEGYDGKENSVAETLRKMGYVESKRK